MSFAPRDAYARRLMTDALRRLHDAEQHLRAAIGASASTAADERRVEYLRTAAEEATKRYKEGGS